MKATRKDTSSAAERQGGKQERTGLEDAEWEEDYEKQILQLKHKRITGMQKGRTTTKKSNSKTQTCQTLKAQKQQQKAKQWGPKRNNRKDRGQKELTQNLNQQKQKTAGATGERGCGMGRSVRKKILQATQENQEQ